MQRNENARRKRFETEVLPHLDAMHRTALRLTRSASDADDLVQDAVVKAYRFFDNYEEGTNVRAWLLKILTNLFFSKHRRGTLELNVANLAMVDPVADGWVSAASMAPSREPEKMVERPLLEGAVARVLEEIPEDFRTVLVLVDVEGLTYREVAEAMNCPMGTVMSRLHRARRAVAQKLGIVPASAEAAPSAAEERVVSLDGFRRRKERVG
ncbi:MAG: sigma-70 family RNA polymerase sigma factor [Myxococcales bacterium]|nr:sigma-70 family RNA polymerase sigma factor [Myxococcales bacterium]